MERYFEKISKKQFDIYKAKMVNPLGEQDI